MVNNANEIMNKWGLILSSFLIILAFLIMISIFPYSLAKGKELPDVFISSDVLLQADTLLIVVKNEPKPILGNLGLIKLRFFRSENQKDWVAVVGMLINKAPGNYKLSIQVPEKLPYQKNIKVLKRNFSITAFPTTSELLAKGMTAKKIINTIKKTDDRALDKFLNIVTLRSRIAKPFIYPLAELSIARPSGGYGDIRKYQNYYIQHLGVDLKVKINTPIYAINDGLIIFEKNLPDYGNTLAIDHGLGVYSLYLHLSEFKIETGKEVKQGDVVALSGATGYVTGPHLHFSIKIRGATVDPLKFIATTQNPW